AHEVHKVGRGTLVDLARTIHAENHPVGVPVSDEVRNRGDAEGNQHARLAADQVTHKHENGREGGHEERSAQNVHRDGYVGSRCGMFKAGTAEIVKFTLWSPNLAKRRGVEASP